MTPNPAFRINPDRSIYVRGTIDRELVRSLTPQILALQYESRDPITVFIDSPGGSPDDMLDLLNLLKAPDQDSNPPCNIITAAVTNAYSAAADLLAFGDYAVAFPNSRILFHGGRVPTATEVTAERSSILALFLRLKNEDSAMDLAKEIQIRFMLRFVTSRHEFDGLRTGEANPDLSDLECLIRYIRPKLSTAAQNILTKARARYARYEEMVESVIKKRSQIKAAKTQAEIEAVELKAIVDFEVKQNKNNPDWKFQSLGLTSLTDDFLLFRSYEDVLESESYKSLCVQYGMFLVSDEITKETNLIANEDERIGRWTDLASPFLKPIWAFFVALCHTLQQGEDEFLSAEDAYWLGLIDEIIGKDDLVHMRYFRENMPTVQPEASSPAAA